MPHFVTMTVPVLAMDGDEVKQAGVEEIHVQIGVCRNCRFWNILDVEDKDGYRLGYCENFNVSKQVFSDIKQFREDFGCIHFEVKDENEHM